MIRRRMPPNPSSRSSRPPADQKRPQQAEI
jgi:hypothetical protein